MMDKKRVEEVTGSYEEWLIESLKDKKEADIFSKVALEEFQKDGDLDAFLLSLRHLEIAQGN